MRSVLLAVLVCSFGLVAATPITAAAQAKQRSIAARPAPLYALEEAKDFVRALRSMEGRTQSGMSYREMNREMGDLTIAVNAFREVLERRKETKLLQQVDDVFAPYKDAQTFWDWCTAADICSYGFVNVNGDSNGDKFVRQLLERYPSLNASENDGGVFSSDPRAGSGTIWKGTLVGKLWHIGSGRSKALRDALQSRGP